jgi:hypothetical protein
MMSQSIVLGEFALNPACVNSFNDLKDIGRRFGFQHGAVISDFPNEWEKIVRQKASELQEPDKSAFCDRLQKLKQDAIVRTRKNKEGSSWLEQVRLAHAETPFYSVLHTESVDTFSEYSSVIDADELTADLRECKVKRTASGLISSIFPLVVSSDRFSVIDPFIEPNEANLKFLRALIQTRRTNGFGILYLDLHLEFDANAPRRDGTEACFREFENWVKMHPRYLLTDRGGVRLDRGISIPADIVKQNHDTDVVMMTNSFKTIVERRYNGTYEPLKLVSSRKFQT